MAHRVEIGTDPHQHPGKQAFYDLRRTLWILGYIYERGMQRAFLQDQARSSAIAIRVYWSILTLNPSAHCLFILRFLESGKLQRESPESLCFTVMTWRTISQYGSLIRWKVSLGKATFTMELHSFKNSIYYYVCSPVMPSAYRLRSSDNTERRRSPHSPSRFFFRCVLYRMISVTRWAWKPPKDVPFVWKETKAHCSGCRAIRYCSPGKSWTLKYYSEPRN